MSKAIIDEQYLTDIADAIRAKNGSADTYTPSEMATAIEDLPTPTTVTKGLVFSDYDNDGYPTKAEFVGSWTAIPNQYLYNASTTSNVFKKITSLTVPNGVTGIGNDAFRNCPLTQVIMPHNAVKIGQQCFMSSKITSIEFYGDVTWGNWGSFSSVTTLKTVIFGGEVGNLLNSVFANDPVETYDFSHCTSIPSLYSVASLGHANGCVIKVPSALLSTWQTAAVWQDLTGVVWQGV